MAYEELLNNKEFNEQVASAKNAEEVVALFAEKGVEVPLEIAQELFEEPSDLNGELSEEDLDNVAGGKWGGAILGGGVAYIVSRLTGKSRIKSAYAAGKHAYYGYTKLSW